MIPSTPVNSSAEIPALAAEFNVIGIDEAQFFDDGVIDVANQLAQRGARVIVAGLDMDYTGKPFGQIPNLLAIAEYITKLHAICMVCGNIANYSYRKTNQDDQVVLGEKNIYEPRCRQCFQKTI
jgi:thymidine kinase